MGIDTQFEMWGQSAPRTIARVEEEVVEEGQDPTPER